MKRMSLGVLMILLDSATHSTTSVTHAGTARMDMMNEIATQVRVERTVTYTASVAISYSGQEPQCLTCLLHVVILLPHRHSTPPCVTHGHHVLANTCVSHFTLLVRCRGGRTRFRGYVTITRILRVYCLCA